MGAKPTLLILLAGLGLAAADGAEADRVEAVLGTARALDGDTLELEGWRFRLHGIDAPEPGQVCARQGVPWPCGAAAAAALRRLAAGGAVTCRATGRVREGVPLAKCQVDRLDLGAEMVTRGLALPDPSGAPDYLPNYREARSLGEGIFGGAFVVPARWRRGERLPAERLPAERSTVCPDRAPRR